MVYTCFRGFNKAWNKNQPDVYEVSHAEFAKLPLRPFFLGESTYEGEHGAWGSAVQARKQAYWCVLGGGFGHAYGSPDWNFPTHWREVLDLPGAHSLKHFRTLFESRPLRIFTLMLSPVDADEAAPHQRNETLEIAVVASAAANSLGSRPTASV